jgi:predicted RNA-binding Zn-ribbon protein involved in translation (DUF1610 family)
MSADAHRLGTVEASEALITDLYVDLRRRVNSWAAITHQTAQARMGYIGQHLVSVATGYPGARSGARGKDLILPNGEYAEIKTCYRVDQLGKCLNCGAAVASIELQCPVCGSTNIDRKDDSKWLIGIRNEEEFAKVLEPAYYFLVLLDFVDLLDPTVIRASIWRVDPSNLGFAYCMIDYHKNSAKPPGERAPFNFWPFSLKMDIMKALLIYRSFIMLDGTIRTDLFPGRDQPRLHPVEPLPKYAQSTNLTKQKCVQLGNYLSVAVNASDTKRDMLTAIRQEVERRNIEMSDLADSIAKALYLPDIEEHYPTLPATIKEKIGVLPRPSQAVAGGSSGSLFQ